MLTMMLSNRTSNQSIKTNSNCPFDDWTQNEQHLYVDLDTFWYIFLALITTVGLLVSFVSNMIIIYLFTRTPILRKNPSNVVAVNLSLSDLLYCIQWPSIIYSSVTQSTWILENKFVCQVFGFITVSTALSSILTILFMSIERAIVITHPIHVRNRFTNRTAWLIIVLIWLLSIATSLPPLFGRYNRYTLDPSKTSCTLDYLSRKADYKHYILFLFAFYWIPPFFIISICYALIYIKFKRSSRSLEKVGNETEQLQLKRRRLTTQQSTRRFSSSTLACDAQHKLDSLDDDSRQRQRLVWLNEKRNKLRDSIRLHRFVGGLGQHRLRRQQQQSNDADRDQSDQVFYPNDSTGTPDSSRTQQMGHSDNEIVLPPPEPLDLASSVGGGCEIKFIDQESSVSGSLVGSGDRHSRKISMLSRRSKTCDDLRQCSHSVSSNRQSGRRLFVIANCSIDSTTTNNSQSSQQPPPPPQQQQSGSSPSGHQHQQHQQQQQQQQQLQTRQSIQIRLAIMSFYLILLWIVSWTPLASIGVVNSLFECHQTSAIAIFLANTMTKLGPAFDVFIYGISHPKIKSKFKQILKCSSLFSIGSTKEKRKEHMMRMISRHGGINSFKFGTNNLKASKMLSNRFSMKVGD